MTIAATAAEVFFASAIPSVGPPPPPKDISTSIVASGAQAARTEWVIITAVNGSGESANSPEVAIPVPANSVLVVTHGFQVEGNTPNGPTSWNCYMTTAGPGKETKQNTSALKLGASFQEPSSGLIVGTAVPNLVPSVPSFSDGNTNLANTPPATGGITVPQSPLNTPTTNTGRSLEATQSYMAASLNALNQGTTPPKAKN